MVPVSILPAIHTMRTDKKTETYMSICCAVRKKVPWLDKEVENNAASKVSPQSTAKHVPRSRSVKLVNNPISVGMVPVSWLYPFMMK